MAYLHIFDQKCLIYVFLGKNFKNTIVIFEISTLKFVENGSLTDTVSFGIGRVRFFFRSWVRFF